MKITIADLAFEVKETYLPNKNENLPYLGLEHVEPESLHMSSVGSSVEMNSQKFHFKAGDIIFGTLRPYFRKLIIAPFDGVCSTEFSVIRSKNTDDRNFIFYSMALPQFIKYATTNSKGARPRTKWKLFADFRLPSMTQVQRKKIGSILSAYDDLIENNRRRIQLLEQAARLLYKEWFVHLRFPGHEHVKIIDGVPEGWEKRQVKELLAKISRPKKIKKEDYLDDGPIPCVDQSREFIGGYTDDDEAKIDIDRPIIIFGDHTRILKFIDFPFACGADGTQIIISNDEAVSQEYLYFALDAIDLSNYFYARHFKFLKVQYILRPKDMLIDQFTRKIRPLMKQVKVLREQNMKLAKARDLILPRLMNGEIEVGHLKSEVLEATHAT